MSSMIGMYANGASGVGLGSPPVFPVFAGTTMGGVGGGGEDGEFVWCGLC